MRRTFWIIIAAITLVLLLDTAYWKVAAERLRTGYTDWVAERVAEGWTVTSATASLGGWPRASTVTVPNLTLRHNSPNGAADVNLAFADVTLSVALVDPADLQIILAGPTRIQAGSFPGVTLTGDETTVSVPLQPDRQPVLILHGSGLRLEAATGAWSATIGLLNAQVVDALVSAGDKSRSGTTFSMSSEAIALPATMKWPLGRNISSLSMDGTLNRLPSISGGIRRSAENWRDHKGSVNISRLTMGWGPLGLTSAATFALDDQLQPTGSGTARVVGYARALDQLANSEALTRSAATVAKAMLSLIAGTSDTNESQSVDVPLTLQYRTLSIGQVPLAQLAELDWPAQ